MDEGSLSTTEQWHYQCDTAGGGAQLIMVWAANFLTQRLQCGNSFSQGQTRASHGFSKNDLNTIDQRFIYLPNTEEVTLGPRSLTMHLWTQNVACRKEWLLWGVRSTNQVDTVRLESILL